MQNIFDKYDKIPNDELIEQEVKAIQTEVNQYNTIERLKLIMTCIDLTTLNTDDNESSVLDMCNKLNAFESKFPGIPGVAAICVYPSLVSVPKKHLMVPGIKIASVAGGFPSSQTFQRIKILEAQMAVDAGADEIDIVMPAGRFLAGDYTGVAGEIAVIKKSIGNANLKVILETGLLNMYNIRKATILALHSGADFVKTSTGKLSPASTYAAAYMIGLTIAEYYRKTGRKVGMKPAGGIVLPEDAIVYSMLTEKILSQQWLDPSLFRIGASRLVNNLLNAIIKAEGGFVSGEPYF